MNAMYFKLGQGEEVLPLRDMAIKNFPNVDLMNTTIYADDYNENAVLKFLTKQIKEGKFDTLYANNLNVIYECMSYCKIRDIIKARPEFKVEFKDGSCYDADVIKGIEQEHKDNAERIEKFNEENEPFDITDLDYKYSLALRLSFIDGEYKDYGQAAFDNYALSNGEEENTYGNGYDWARVIKRVFRNDKNIKQVEFDPEHGCFFCNSKDLSILENMAVTLKQLYDNTELFERAVSIAMSEEMSVEELLERDWQSDYNIKTEKGIIYISSQGVVRLMHGEMDMVNGICNGDKFEMDKFELFQMRVGEVSKMNKGISVIAKEPDCEDLLGFTVCKQGMGGMQGI